jgi:hypothetical protein
MQCVSRPCCTSLTPVRLARHDRVPGHSAVVGTLRDYFISGSLMGLIVFAPGVILAIIDAFLWAGLTALAIGRSVRDMQCILGRHVITLVSPPFQIACPDRR